MDSDRYASFPVAAVTADYTITSEFGPLPSAMIEFFLRHCDFSIILGDPNDGRTSKLITGAQKRRRPYLLIFP